MMWDSYTDIIIIYGCSALALVWAFFNAMAITAIKVEEPDDLDEENKPLKDDQEKFKILQKVRKLIA